MKSVLNERSLPYTALDRQEFYPKLELLGRQYNNVISKDLSNYVTRPFKYYVNQEVGLIGFEDSQGVLWLLAE